MHHMAETLDHWFVFLRGATVNHHGTPLSTGSRPGGGLCDSPLHVAIERVNVDLFHRAPVSLVVLVHPAVSARFAQIGPVGGFVTRAAKLRINQRLQKQRAKAVRASFFRRPLSPSTYKRFRRSHQNWSQRLLCIPKLVASTSVRTRILLCEKCPF